MIIKNPFKSFSFSSIFNPGKNGRQYFHPYSTGSIFGESHNLKNFLEIPELNSIINIRARAMSSWKLMIVSKGTGKEAKNNESLVRILKTPNWFQAQSEFWRQSNLWRDIYGNEFIYLLTPIGMPNSYKGMFTLDSSKVEIRYKGDQAYFLEETGDNIEYVYKFPDGKTIILDTKDLIHLNDNRVGNEGLNQGFGKNFLYGTSKMDSQVAAINNIRKAYEKRGIVLDMPVGILSNAQDDAVGQAVPHDAEEKEALQKTLRTRGAGPIITDLNTKYNAMNVNSNSMGLFEEVREDTGKLCDAYGVPYALLADAQTKGLGSKGMELKESKSQFIEGTIIPDAQEKVDALNLKLDTENKSWELVADYKHLPVFSEDVKERSETLSKTVSSLSQALTDKAITLQQYKDELKKFGI